MTGFSQRPFHERVYQIHVFKARLPFFERLFHILARAKAAPRACEDTDLQRVAFTKLDPSLSHESTHFGVSAFKLSGRFIRTINTCPRTSVSTTAISMTSFVINVQDLRL